MKNQNQTKTKNKHHKLTELPVHYPRDGFLDKFDKRERIYAILSTSYNEIADDLGGIENLSRIQKCLIERFVFIQQVLRGIERRILKSKNKKLKSRYLKRWSYNVNSLLGLSRQLGVGKKRKAKFVSLSAYKDRKGEPA